MVNEGNVMTYSVSSPVHLLCLLIQGIHIGCIKVRVVRQQVDDMWQRVLGEECLRTHCNTTGFIQKRENEIS